METLLEIYNKHKKGDWPDKGSVHSYIEVYEEILAPYREMADFVLEIGLMDGQSLRMWDEYFYGGSVYGIDCSEQPHGGLADLRPIIAEQSYNIFIGDATNPSDIENCFTYLKFNVIIEDAGHDLNQQFQIYKTLKPYLAEGAIYIIEDIQDIDATRYLFENIDHEKEVTILDRRHIKNRYDDVLVIIK